MKVRKNLWFSDLIFSESTQRWFFVTLPNQLCSLYFFLKVFKVFYSSITQFIKTSLYYCFGLVICVYGVISKFLCNCFQLFFIKKSRERSSLVMSMSNFWVVSIKNFSRVMSMRHFQVMIMRHYETSSCIMGMTQFWVISIRNFWVISIKHLPEYMRHFWIMNTRHFSRISMRHFWGMSMKHLFD